MSGYNHAESAPEIKDSFSWGRVVEFGQYYAPQLKKQLLIYAIVSIVCALLTFLPVSGIAQVGIFTICWTVIPYMFYLAPLVFAKGGDQRIVTRLIPARASEKFMFYLIYTLLVIPAVVYILPYAAGQIYLEIPAVRTDELSAMIELQTRRSVGLITVLNLLSAVSGVLTCLFTVLYFRHNRLIKAVISVFIVQIGVGIIGIFWGASEFMRGVDDGRAGDYNPQNCNLVDTVIDEMSHPSPYMICTLAILAVYVGIMLWMSYRAVKKKNL